MKGCRPLTGKEPDRALAALNGRMMVRNRALFLTQFYTGRRISQLLSLEVGDVLAADGDVMKSVYFKRRSVKGKVEGQEVPLHDKAREALRLWLMELEKASPLFEDDGLFQSMQTGRAISRVSAYHIYRKAFRKAGIRGKLGTHCLRKTFAFKVHKMHGNDLAATQILLGHVSATSTGRYLGFNERTLWASTLEKM